MTDRIQYCYEDDDVVGVAENMAHLGVRRLAVLNHDKRLVGIVALEGNARELRRGQGGQQTAQGRRRATP